MAILGALGFHSVSQPAFKGLRLAFSDLPRVAQDPPAIRLAPGLLPLGPAFAYQHFAVLERQEQVICCQIFSTKSRG